MSEEEQAENPSLKEQLNKAKGYYRGCIRWYLELLRYHESACRREDWSEQGRALQEDAETALTEAAYGILHARTRITNIEMKLSGLSHLRKKHE